MEYNFREIEKKWQSYWKDQKTYEAKVDSSKEKFYVLDMFPYPSGAGLHVGHPLGYIASDIYSRYKRHLGFNVLHPMGYDSFGLPAEQYAIQTGQHPRITTKENINTYRKQLDKIGFSFDWSKEVRTSNPDYYKWTQWIFIQLFDSWYDNNAQKAKPINELIEYFEKQGNSNLNAHGDQEELFSAEEWASYTEKQQAAIIMNYRIAYLADSFVNWCPALGTVLANDEIKDGVSERGGHPVERKKMRQWSMRITAYAQRLLDGLENIQWSDALKESQRNWIGRSEGASIHFEVDQFEGVSIEVFTTRPDTIFGASFMVLAPEHELVEKITSPDQKDEIVTYQDYAASRSERERMTEVKKVSGAFTGAYAKHPISGSLIPIWISDYVLASYGTGAVMAVPSGDQRDWDFAKKFDLAIPAVIEGQDISTGADDRKDGKLINSDFLNGLLVPEAIKKSIEFLEKEGIGKGKITYRLRDAVFSRQRYWGEPIPIYYEDGIAKAVKEQDLPIQLPEVDQYLPTEDGEPPLARAKDWQYHGHPFEHSTMPGWAGSSWYLFRYMDPNCPDGIAEPAALNYWKSVDLYFGGAEHATGHLLYSRFWTKFLYDRRILNVEEPFQQLINQGMILGNSRFVYRDKESKVFVSKNLIKGRDVSKIHVDVNLVNGNTLDIAAFKNSRAEYKDASFELEEGEYICGAEVEKMSKSKFNVVNPDSIIEQYGADTLRLYEMFLGPLEQAKPWDMEGIEGVHRFLRKLWRLFHNENNEIDLEDGEANAEALKILHKTIKKVRADIERFSFNTCVSAFMIAVNDLSDIKCKNKSVLRDLCLIVSPFAPHISEELWNKMGNSKSITDEDFPNFDEKHLTENSHKYPVSFNGKMRFLLELPLDLSKEEIQETVIAHEDAQKWLEGKTLRKAIIIPGKIINLVVG